MGGGGRGKGRQGIGDRAVHRTVPEGHPSPVDAPDDATTKQIATTPMALHGIQQQREFGVSPGPSSPRHQQLSLGKVLLPLHNIRAPCKEIAFALAMRPEIAVQGVNSPSRAHRGANR